MRTGHQEDLIVSKPQFDINKFTVGKAIQVGTKKYKHERSWEHYHALIKEVTPLNLTLSVVDTDIYMTSKVITINMVTEGLVSLALLDVPSMPDKEVDTSG